MGIIAEINKEEKVAFPEGKIILLDGRVLDCYPVAKEEETEVVDDSMKLDTTGEYLSVKKKPIGCDLSKSKQVQLQNEDIQKDLFIRNAFYLLAHKERILSDSRMFLCPVAIHNGLAYTGTSGFHKPTLGIYIEWWVNCVGAMRTDKNGRRSLVYHLAGSPLSGANHCGTVYENGEKEFVVLSSFKNYWPLFMDINTRYTEAKYKYQAYSLDQVLAILGVEDCGVTDYAQTIEIEFMKQEIVSLNKQVECLSKERDNWHEKYFETLMKYNEEKVCELYAECVDLETKVNAEIVCLREQKRLLKVDLKCGRIDNIAYQRQLKPIKESIRDLEFRLANFKSSRVKEVFPHESINFTMIENYMKQHPMK